MWHGGHHLVFSELNYQSLVLFKWEREGGKANFNADVEIVRQPKPKPTVFLYILSILSFLSKLLPGKILSPNMDSSPQLASSSDWFLGLSLFLMALWGSAWLSCRSEEGANPSGGFQGDVCFLLLEVANAPSEEIWEAAVKGIPDTKIFLGEIWIWSRSNYTAECSNS